MNMSTWNKSEIGRRFGECRNLGEIIARLERDFSQRGEVICEVRVNGRLLSEDEERSRAASPSSEIDTLAISSEHPESLIREALASALDHLARVMDAGVAAADLFRGPDAHVAQSRFVEVIDGCQWFVETIQGIRGAAQGTGISMRNSESWRSAEARLGSMILELIEACRGADNVLVADLLEYELHNALQVWMDVLRSELEVRVAPITD